MIMDEGVDAAREEEEYFVACLARMQAKDTRKRKNYIALDHGSYMESSVIRRRRGQQVVADVVMTS
jgi:hypothetical protein